MNLSHDVKQKVEATYEHHHQFDERLSQAWKWIKHARQVMDMSSKGTPKSKEDLEARLTKIEVYFEYGNC